MQGTGLLLQGDLVTVQDLCTGFVVRMVLKRPNYAEGGRNTDTGNIGSCGIERNWISRLRRWGFPGSGNVDGEEKSSETGSDFVSTSAVRRPINVAGTPSICVTTQMHSIMMRRAIPLVQREERNIPRTFWIIRESTINKTLSHVWEDRATSYYFKIHGVFNVVPIVILKHAGGGSCQVLLGC